MRRAARTDANHAAIVAALRAAGCDVFDLSCVGRGCPDLLVQRGGRLLLLEVKRPAGPRGGTKDRGPTEAQVRFWLRWPVRVVTGPEGAVAAVGL